MDKPAKRNLFDDDSDEEDDYKPDEEQLDPMSVPTAPVAAPLPVKEEQAPAD